MMQIFFLVYHNAKFIIEKSEQNTINSRIRTRKDEKECSNQSYKYQFVVDDTKRSETS